MTEISPIDQAVLDVLQSSRGKVEQETSERALRIHDQARVQDASVTIGGLLIAECNSLNAAFVGRHNFYFEDASWLQKRRMEKDPEITDVPGRKSVNGVATPLTSGEKRMVRLHNQKYWKIFRSGSLFPQTAELTSEGPVIQDWVVERESTRITTFYRVFNPEHDVVGVTPLHTITQETGDLYVSENGKVLDEQGYFFPLGIIMEANRQVRASVPRRISKKW